MGSPLWYVVFQKRIGRKRTEHAELSQPARDITRRRSSVILWLARIHRIDHLKSQRFQVEGERRNGRINPCQYEGDRPWIINSERNCPRTWGWECRRHTDEADGNDSEQWGTR